MAWEETWTNNEDSTITNRSIGSGPSQLIIGLVMLAQTFYSSGDSCGLCAL